MKEDVFVKEEFEWIQTWCDRTANKDLPRVLLVGDSITRAYYEYVKDKLEGKCYVDYIAMSYAVDSKVYTGAAAGLAADSDYALIHFNHGLHGWHMTDRVYGEGIEKLLKEIGKNRKVILATSTIVKETGNARIDYKQTGIILRRNEVVKFIAGKYGYGVNDLYAVSANLPNEMRTDDGVHYTEAGSERLAEHVAKAILAVL